VISLLVLALGPVALLSDRVCGVTIEASPIRSAPANLAFPGLAADTPVILTSEAVTAPPFNVTRSSEFLVSQVADSLAAVLPAGMRNVPIEKSEIAAESISFSAPSASAARDVVIVKSEPTQRTCK